MEDFAVRCALAGADHGVYQRSESGEDKLIAKHSTPELKLNYEAFEWRLLPKDLLLRVLELPHLTRQAHSYLEAVSDEIAMPPDFEEFYFERSSRFSRLGLRALDLARDLRLRYGASAVIAPLDPEDDYDLREHLQLILEDTSKYKRRRSEQADA